MNAERLRNIDHMDPDYDACYVFIATIKDATPNPHCHEFFEVMLTTSGKAIHCVNGKKQLLMEGALTFIRPDDEHSFEPFEEWDCQFMNIAFPLYTFSELAEFLGPAFPTAGLLSAPESPRTILSGIEFKALKDRVLGLNSLPFSNKFLIRMELRTLLVQMVTSVLAFSMPSDLGTIPGWLQELCNAMSRTENFTKGTEAMLGISGKSHEHLCRVFRQYLDETPIHYINDLRLNYAANLLINSNFSILKISLEAGFESLAHFYRVFRKRFGVPPADFRRQGQKTVSLI